MPRVTLCTFTPLEFAQVNTSLLQNNTHMTNISEILIKLVKKVSLLGFSVLEP